MQLKLTPEQELQLAQTAALEGKTSDELAQELFSRVLANEVRFVAAVQVGLDAANRGDFVENAEVWARVERVLQSS